MKTCCISVCNGKAFCRSLCAYHYRYFDSRGVIDKFPKRMSPMEWIEQNADTTEEDCIIWPFARTKAGYPNMKYKDGFAVASRVMCIVAHGKPPSEKYQAAHNCGKGRDGCMNPNHLEWKTVKENEADKLVHGTRYRGDECTFAKLTWETVRQIRKDAETMRNCDIARKHGIDPRQTHKIIKRGCWVHDPLESKTDGQK